MLKTSKDYKPAVIAETANLSESDWLKYRQRGIGGSDAAAVMGLSPFGTAYDLYYEKIGVKPAIQNESNWVAKRVGHLLENLVGEIFAKKTNLPITKGTAMYKHPDYPFMLANVDYFVTMPDGKTAILECKTANYNSQDKWADGAVPINYEVQVRHYMAVMNIDTAFVACLFGNNENEFVYRKIERDFDFEYNIIEQEHYFWREYVEKNVEPPYTENPDLVLESMRKFYGNADLNAPVVTLDESICETIEQYIELRRQKLDCDHKSKSIDDEMKRRSAAIIGLLGANCTAVCQSGTHEYSISYKPSYAEKITKDGIEALKMLHFDWYEKFVSTTESRRFSVTKRGIGA